ERQTKEPQAREACPCRAQAKHRRLPFGAENGAIGKWCRQQFLKGSFLALASQAAGSRGQRLQERDAAQQGAENTKPEVHELEGAWMVARKNVRAEEIRNVHERKQ